MNQNAVNSIVACIVDILEQFPEDHKCRDHINILKKLTMVIQPPTVSSEEFKKPTKSVPKYLSAHDVMDMMDQSDSLDLIMQRKKDKLASKELPPIEPIFAPEDELLLDRTYDCGNAVYTPELTQTLDIITGDDTEDNPKEKKYKKSKIKGKCIVMDNSRYEVRGSTCPKIETVNCIQDRHNEELSDDEDFEHSQKEILEKQKAAEAYEEELSACIERGQYQNRQQGFLENKETLDERDRSILTKVAVEAVDEVQQCKIITQDTMLKIYTLAKKNISQFTDEFDSIDDFNAAVTTEADRLLLKYKNGKRLN